MAYFVLVLSIFLGVLSVINKALLMRNQRAGWTSGMLIGLLSALYFYLIELKILAFAEFGFFAVMLYGYVSHVKAMSSDRTRVINIVLTCVLVALSVALFTGKLTIYQLISSLSFIWGGYALAVHKRRIGWCLLLAAHVSTSLASYLAGQLIFSGLQVVSGLVCIYALVGMLRAHGHHKSSHDQ
ncbi:MAG: hypothetical protein QOG13_3307 [Sphingomonadales bacterium]|jgi:hypothetical protein|nr:hypothetical protein [Sphingomonadales bacterium]